jgi:hypothetical protein
VAVLFIRHVLGDAEMPHLRIIEHLVDRIDRAAGYAGGVKLPDPGLGQFLLGELVDRGVELIVRAGRRGGMRGLEGMLVWRQRQTRANNLTGYVIRLDAVRFG